jgi:phosphoglycolate phosphatase
MALLTSNARENVQEFLQNHDLDYFDWVESSKGLFTKQHTITHQIKKHKLHEHDVIYIGDETRDIFASHKCRIKIISVTWGLHTQNLLESYNPDFMADTPLQILSIVKNLLP